MTDVRAAGWLPLVLGQRYMLFATIQLAENGMIDKVVLQLRGYVVL
jgi:hypothetical protein